MITQGIVDSTQWLDDLEGHQHITFGDLDLFEKILIGSERYITTYQKRAADITNDGSIDSYDMNIIQMILGEPLTEYYDLNEVDDEQVQAGGIGDINLDGIVNINDIIILIQYIVGAVEELSPEATFEADIVQDGYLNVSDIIGLVNNIINPN